MLVDQVPAHRFGLLLGQNFGEVVIAVVIGERRDDDLRRGATGPLEPAGHVVELGLARLGQHGAAGRKQVVGAKRAAGSLGARLKENALTVKISAAVEVARQGPRFLERRQVVFQGRERAHPGA